MERINLKRVFLYDNKTLSDVDSSFSPEQVLEHYSNIYPELINAKVEQKEIKNDTIQFEFNTKVGTKG